MHAPHSADMLKAKVSELGAPPQKQRVECQHGGDVPDSNVSHVDTPRREHSMALQLQVQDFNASTI